jgi:hypothetical protein
VQNQERDAAVSGSFRRGNVVLVPSGAGLPPYCIKCGAPPVNEQRKSTFSWHEPRLYLLLFLGVLPYFFFAPNARKEVELIMPLCSAHRRPRRLLARGGTLLPVGGWLMVLWVKHTAAAFLQSHCFLQDWS